MIRARTLLWGTIANGFAGWEVRCTAARETTAENAAWVGTPGELIERVRDYNATAGGFEIASLQVNFNMISYQDAARSMKLFGREVIPHFADAAVAAAP